ncbi:MAG: hypothetical protein NW217_13115 [Hyphomicrobiaceae bacterium]|nr:hypothetical protein [Hyphomicrobiaceae bacterium]
MPPADAAPAGQPAQIAPGEPATRDDYTEYMADLILELHEMAVRTGRKKLAERLLAAYELAHGEQS